MWKEELQIIHELQWEITERLACDYEKESIEEEALLNEKVIEKDTVLEREANNSFECNDTGLTEEEQKVALCNVIDKLR